VNAYGHQHTLFLLARASKCKVYVAMPPQPEILPRIHIPTFGKKDLKSEITEGARAIDDTQSRVNIWRTLFGDEQMPAIEVNAVEKYAGLLDKHLPPDFPVEKIIERVKKS